MATMSLPQPPPGPGQPPSDYVYPEGVLFHEETSVWEFKNDEGELYTFNFVLDKWIPKYIEKIKEEIKEIKEEINQEIKDVDIQEINEEDNKRDIRQHKRQKLEELKEQKKPKRKESTSVYVSNLPSDTTIEDIVKVFIRYGLIVEDFKTEKPKVKMYYKEGKFDGLALIVYVNKESVSLAVEMLDDSYFGQDLSHGRIKVVPAQLEEDELLRLYETIKEGDDIKTKRLTHEERELLKSKTEQMKRKLTDWEDPPPNISSTKTDLIRKKIWDKTIVIRNMFRYKELQQDPMLEMDLKDDIQEECDKLGIGNDITKITIFGSNGVVTVKFKNSTLSEKCISLFDGRYFDGMTLDVTLYQGENFEKDVK